MDEWASGIIGHTLWRPYALDQSVRFIAVLCGLMLAGFIGSLLTGGWLNQWGIHPRQVSSIWTIFTAPFLRQPYTPVE